MNKSDYDKYYKKGGTYVIPVEAFNELFDELERLSINYEQALEDLDKKDNIINEIEKMFNHEILIKYYYGMSYEFEINDFKDDILKIIKGSDKE